MVPCLLSALSISWGGSAHAAVREWTLLPWGVRLYGTNVKLSTVGALLQQDSPVLRQIAAQLPLTAMSLAEALCPVVPLSGLTSAFGAWIVTMLILTPGGLQVVCLDWIHDLCDGHQDREIKHLLHGEDYSRPRRMLQRLKWWAYQPVRATRRLSGACMGPGLYLASAWLGTAGTFADALVSKWYPRLSSTEEDDGEDITMTGDLVGYEVTTTYRRSKAVWWLLLLGEEARELRTQLVTM